MIVLPTRSIPNYFYEITIDSVPYRLEFLWNSRFDYWTVNIKTITGEPLIYGVKLIINYELIRLYGADNLPKGALIPVDTTGKLERIGYEDLTESIDFVYMTREEFNAIV